MATNFGKVELPVSFSPQTAFPLDSRSYFESKGDAINAAMTAAEAGSADSVYYFGQIIAVQETESAPWTPTVTTQGSSVEVPTFTLSCEEVPPSADNDPTTYVWHLSCSNGFTTTTDTASGKLTQFDLSGNPVDPSPDALILSGGFFEGDFHIPQDPGLTGTVDVKFERTAVEVQTWNLYIIDASAPNNLKKIEGGAGGGGGGGGGDVEAETARAMAAEQALSGRIETNASNINKISADLSAAKDSLSGYLPLSGGTLTGDTTVDSNLSVSGGLSVGEAQFNDGNETGLTITRDDESYQFGGTQSENQVARKGDLSVYVLSSQLSDAMAGNLSSANAANPVMLSSDLSALVEKAIKFKGAVSTSAALPSADVDIGDMYIITGDGDDAGAEFVCTSLSGDPVEPVWSELGREGTTAALWDAVTTLSNTTIPTLCTGLSNAITANAENINTLSNTTIPDLCTALSNGITANAENIGTLSNETIPGITADVQSISTDIYGDGETSGLSGKVDGLTADVGTISTDIYTAETGLSAKVGTVSADVDQLKDDVGYISSFVSSLPVDISAVSSAISTLQDNAVSVKIDGLSSTELNVLHISEADYHQLVVDGDIDPKTIYIVSADGYQNMYGERITNLSTLSTDLSSAANVSFVTAYVGDQMATVNGDVEYLSNAINAITADINYLSGQIDSLSGAMVSAVVISAETRAISADVTNGIATISGLSVSDLAWDISVINGGDSGYVPQTEEPIEP